MFDDIKNDLNEMFDDIISPISQPVEELSEFMEVPITRNHAIFEAIFNIFREVGIYKEAFLCGGFIRHSCSQRRPVIAVYGDIDIYCRSDSTYKELEKFMDYNSQFMLKFENDLSKSYARKSDYSLGIRAPKFPTTKPIQLIKPIREGNIITYGSMQEILNNFDFTVIRAGCDLEQYYKNKHAIVDSDFLKHEQQKRLVFRKIHCPISSLHRVMKYSSKGYKISSKETLKLFLDWEKRPQSYKNEIIEFLSKTFEPDETGQLKANDLIEINRMYRMLRVD